MPRKVSIKPNDKVPACPKCGNATHFTVHSQQVAEDCCEVWAVCKCGFDPTENNNGHRLEDVWGGTDDDNCINAIAISWTDGINELTQEAQ